MLNNPITRKKIEYLCGSVEAFVNDPSMIQEFANDNPKFGWMRAVTQEEAKASYERLCAWAKTSSSSNNVGSGTIGEWIYSPPLIPYIVKAILYLLMIMFQTLQWTY